MLVENRTRSDGKFLIRKRRNSTHECGDPKTSEANSVISIQPPANIAGVLQWAFHRALPSRVDAGFTPDSSESQPHSSLETLSPAYTMEKSTESDGIP
jgi:hypothetical protein